MENGTFARILLATDGSAPAAAAARLATSFAHASSAAVRVVHVWNMEVHDRGGVWDLETRREAEELLSKTVDELGAAGVDADGELIRADSKYIASALAESAVAFDADLVVLGSRGLSDWQSMRKHSVSHQLLTALDCPLLVVRGTPPAPHDPRRVLLAIAGGDDVATAVQAAVAAASSPGSRVLVLHVEQAIFGLQGFAYVEPQGEVHETINQATEMLEQAGILAEALAAGPGHVADVVAHTAEGWSADMIVIGSSRMGDLASMVLGSVTHDLLRASDKPILVAARTR